jgi:hypothetical protein
VPCLAETIFTIESIMRTRRAQYFGSSMPSITLRLRDDRGGTIAEEVVDGSADLPVVHAKVQPILSAAIESGFRLLRCPRLGMPRPELPAQWFLQEESPDAQRTRQRVFSECSREIERRGAGIAHAKRIGERYASGNWREGLLRAPQSDQKAIGDAIAEWADGDAIAAHVAYGNDYFCTRDNASAAGDASIFSRRNREWLMADYGIRIIRPSELPELLP